MKFNVTRYFTSVIGIGITCLTVSAYAGQACDLGQVCPLPGNDGGITYFRVYPNQGNNFTCTITAANEKVVFYLYSGKNYSITDGSGIHMAEPIYTANIRGRFNNPDPQSNGNIKFKYFKLFSDGSGTVICNPAQSE